MPEPTDQNRAGTGCRAHLDAFRSRDDDPEGEDPRAAITKFHVEEFETDTQSGG